jgi:hypothetical protein
MKKQHVIRVLRDLGISLGLSGGILALFTRLANPLGWPHFCRPLFFVIALLLFSFIHGSRGQWITDKLKELGRKK